jgi:hypothetical protein
MTRPAESPALQLHARTQRDAVIVQMNMREYPERYTYQRFQSGLLAGRTCRYSGLSVRLQL